MKRCLLILAVCAVIVVWMTVLRQTKPPPEIRTHPPAALRIRPAGERVPAHPLIRVNVTPGSARWTLAVDGPFEVRSLDSGKVLSRQTKLTPAVVSATSTGIRWSQTVTPVTRLEIVPRNSPAIWIGAHQYRGTVRILRQADGRLLAVNVLPLEDYVACVVNGEMPWTFPLEARKAQAIVARTYALYQRRLNRRRKFDLHSDARSQQYLGTQY
ncbi:MAG: SpoIID/LytB domain-containing protein, partial [Planctomycetes bacterium]|nr:SpoIID/LytB domain-containing protein [Planctomycetota bacterium]